MKKYLIYCCTLCGLLGLSFSSTWACDVCSGAGAGSYMGILPQFRNNFVGIRWQYLAFRSVSHHDGTVAHEHLHDYAVWGRWYPHARWQVLATLPLRNTYRHYSQITENVTGMGDAMAIVNYMPINTGDSLLHTWKHTLLVGAGLKAPTGRFNTSRNPETGLWKIPPSMQLGTGTWDYLLQLNYTLRRNKWGINANVLYRYNTTHRSDYRFGHQTNAQSTIFYWFKKGEIAILPQVGIWYARAEKDSKYGRPEAMTGGSVVRCVTGIDLYYKRIAWGVHTQLPLAYTVSNGWTTPLQGVSMQFTCLF